MSTTPGHIGRFEVRKLLGKGAQSRVYLAHDPKLNRDVAVKLLKSQSDAQVSHDTRLREARAAARLRHPALVPIFEVGEDGPLEFFVFEYAEGETVADIIRRDGALPPARAVKYMLDVLDGLVHAHAAGIIHRDLKPSNVIVTADGKARVLDFGVASDISAPDKAGDVLFGTPAYMAPEYIDGRTVSPGGDVFAAGLMLFEMVFGKPAVQGDTAFQVLNSICNTDIRLPEDDDNVDAQLRTIIARALRRNPEERYPDAAAMRDALAAYTEIDVAAHMTSTSSTLEFLLRRMSHKSDFPAMSSAVAGLNALTDSRETDAEALASAIVKDFALTNKILKLANSAFHANFGGQISTVSRAIVILGTETVRNLATSLVLFDHMKDKAHAAKLRDDFLRSNLQAMMAREIARVDGDGDASIAEEAFICALFHDLGRLLTHYYFNEEYEAIQRATEVQGRSEAAASAEVLGISYEQLGIGVARRWGFPDSLVHSMKRVPPGTVKLSRTSKDRLRALAAFSHELQGLTELSGGASDERLVALKERFAECVHLDEKSLSAILDRSVDGLRELAGVLGIQLQESRLGRVLNGQDKAPADEAPDEPASAESMLQTVAVAGAAPPTNDTMSVLTAGLADISGALVDGASPGELMQIIVETMYRALAPRRILLCLRDARSGEMRARFGHGEGLDDLLDRFKFKVGPARDLFNASLAKDVDVLINDAADPQFSKHLPEWFTSLSDARTFLLLPMVLSGTPVAMIYVDRAQAKSLAPAPEVLKMLRTLRNQALLALRQARQQR